MNPSGSFHDKTREYGLENIRGVRFYAVDFNRDSWTDLVILPDYFSTPVFFQFSPQKKRFIPLIYDPFSQKVRASFLNFVDLDRDGYLDVLVGILGQRSALTEKSIRFFRGSLEDGRLIYREVQQSLTFVKGESLVNFPLASISVLDFDLDGYLDIFGGVWFSRKHSKRTRVIPDMLFKGNGFQMEDVSYLLEREGEKREVEPFYPNATPTFASSTCDVDQNGYPDILTASSNGYSNKLWLNQYDSKNKGRIFKNFAVQSGYAQDDRGAFQLRGGGRTFSTLCADYNNDSTMDIFLGELTYSYDQEDVDRSSILTGKTAKFPVGFIRTIYTHDKEGGWSQGDRRALWFDYNNDGLMDLLVDNSGFPPVSRLVVFKQELNHSYEDRARLLGVDLVNPQGTIVLDVNGDGRLDILTGQSSIRDDFINPRLYLFENRVERRGRRSIRFFLRGVSSNIQGIGAMLTLKTNRGERRQWVEYHHGAQGSQNEEGILFGLDRGEVPREVLVRWPYQDFETKYVLSRYRFKFFLSLTLCEGGEALIVKRGQRKGAC